MLVITLLGERPMRFMELKRSIGLVSQRMLTRTLRALERDGLISRTVQPVVPPRVDYELTDLGRGLQSLLGQLSEWAFQHAPDVAVARMEYDRLATDDPEETP
jgi:DNA-binding HxlR family transcriptional regulator